MHVGRVDIRTVCGVLIGKPLGRWPLASPSRRKDKNNMDLRIKLRGSDMEGTGRDSYPMTDLSMTEQRKILEPGCSFYVSSDLVRGT